MEDEGFTESMVISNSTYSTVSLANTNFSGLKVIPLFQKIARFQKTPLYRLIPLANVINTLDIVFGVPQDVIKPLGVSV